MNQGYKILFLLAFFTFNVYAQEKKITGIVSDDTGMPLPGVNIVVDGTTRGAQTDFDGNYSITVNVGDILTFSYIGFKSQKITIGTTIVVNVTMQTDASELDEVVVTALGIKRKPKELPYATAMIKQEDLVQAAPVDITTALAGKASGLNINISDNGVNPNSSIVLRAFNSLTGNNGALIVVDGVPQAQNSISSLNANDVESVNILKGASSVTLYGSAGSNGAIIITTKRGQKNEKINIDFNSSVTFENVKYFPKVQTQFGSGSTEGFEYNPDENESWGPRYDGLPRRVGPILSDGTYQVLPYAPVKDNKKNFFVTGLTQQNAISLSGGDANSTYFFSAQHVDRSGVTPNDTYIRDNLRFNASRKYGKLETTTSVSFFQDKTNVAGESPQDGSFYRILLNTPGHIPLTNYKNWRTDKFATPDTYYNAYFKNPYQIIDQNRNTSRSNRLQAITKLDYDFNDWIKASYTLGGTWFNSSYKNTQEAWTYDTTLTYTRPSDEVNAVADGMLQNFRLNSDFLLSFDKNFGEDFNARLILGNHVETYRDKSINIGGTNLFTNIIYNVNVRTGELTGDEGTTQKRLYSYFGDLTLGFRDYLFLTGSYRQDISSTLPKDNNSYGYYSAGISFVPTDAFEGLKGTVLGNLKLNASYAKVGNDAGIGQTNENFQVPVGFPFGGTTGLRPTTIAVDPNLSPEFSTSTEVGLSLDLFKRRISLDANYYFVKVEDQINFSAASYASGASAYLTNIGEIQNKGFEFDLGIVPFKSENFQWDLGFTVSTNKSEVISLNDGAERLQVGTGYQNTAFLYAQIGDAYPSIFAPGYERDDQGRVVINPNTGDPIATSEFINLGSTVPNFIAGVTTKIRYKDFTLSGVADYKTGHVYYSTLVEALEFAGLTAHSASTNRQPFVFPNSSYETSPGSGVYVANTDITTSSGGRNFWQTSYNNIKENYVVDATAIKIREIALDYNLPSKYLKQTPFDALSIGLVANNLIMWRAKENVYTDPEFSINTGGDGVSGIGSTDQAPPTGTYGFKVNLKF
ncbi:TonB-linked SusC/RagA family outer membrane protein [Gelidibacter algens]|uniref:TonB-linked SusC/RagA family outer membrane protein n=1 Tax=Gelidibacter algens TaxID=49280 RepID=A0A327RUC5_9FLAO|nr:SusC/RagA family TonB-linked outer membrane protein [Gelidibacter algens]RAJ19991.1 TonB-linked SusC/RagA family outer membrane protein [Gelidibacter algens]